MISSMKKMFSETEEEEDFFEEENENSKKGNNNHKYKAIVEIFEPSSYRQSNKIMDQVEKGHAVIIKTTKLDQSEVQRLIDIVQGSLYSLKGEFSELAPNTYICSPKTIKIEETNVIGGQ